MWNYIKEIGVYGQQQCCYFRVTMGLRKSKLFMHFRV